MELGTYPVVTVSEVNRLVKSILLAEDILYALCVRGEVSNFTRHFKSGHLYFTLKDAQSQIKCVMFRHQAERLGFLPENGMRVIVRGDVQVYEQGGVYQIYCTDIQPDGLGARYLALEQLKTRLAQEGIFDESRKKPLPAFPEKIGVITSKTGAARHDVESVLARRYPAATLCLFPTPVQGDAAAGAICRSLKQAAAHPGIDVIILARGGGSTEDLWVFNSETVARAIAQCPVPVISAVGHETDVTLADLAADLRAPTPTAAAELAVPDREALLDRVRRERMRLNGAAYAEIAARAAALSSLRQRIAVNSPQQRCEAALLLLSSYRKRLGQGMAAVMAQKQNAFSAGLETLSALSPLEVLKRGYALLLRQNGSVAACTDDLAVGETVTAVLSDGTVKAKILSSVKGGAPAKAPGVDG